MKRSSRCRFRLAASDLRKENTRLKQLVAEVVLENRLLKKSVTASDSGDDTCD
jgi:hypothetical protein